MRYRTLWVTVVATALMLAMATVAYAAPAPPFETNSECLECHDVAGAGAITRVDFNVGAVNYASCRGCHADIQKLFVGTRFTDRHWHGGEDCVDCHQDDAPPELPEGFGLNVTLVNTAYGYFKSAGSPLASASSLHAIHANPGNVETVLGTTYSSKCSRCHAAAACSTCHTAPVAHHPESTPAYPAVIYKQAAATTVSLAPSTCVNPACHSRLKAGLAGFTPLCSSCHEHADNVVPHGYDTVDHVADDASVDGIACSQCHALDLAAEHDKPTSSSSAMGCATCHPTPRDTFGAWDQSCATGGCHTAGSTAPMHGGAATSHSVVAAGEICLDCHEGTDLGSIHAGASDGGGATSCFVCHTPAGAPATSDCTVCHFTFEGHYDPVAHTSSWDLASCGGVGCHTTRDLMGAHTEKNAAFECAGCHDSADASVVGAIAAGDTACGACHTGIAPDQGHRSVHWADPLLVGATGPNYSYWTGSMGSQPTGDCAGCHVSNLVDEHMGVVDSETGYQLLMPRRDDTGAALDCGSCHASSDPTVLLAIATGQTKCDSCHVVHGPINAVHTSTFVDSPQVACEGCHSANLADEHNGSYTVVTPGGTSLTGCSVCHEYYEAPRGTVVHTAISVTNDTRCTACHSATHPDLGSHSATAAGSLDACGPCHGDPSGGSLDVQAIHASAAPGPCAVCHSNSARVPDISAETAECASCHAAQGVDYHRDMDVHLAPDSAGCQACHHEDRDVTAVHEAGCATCHNDTVVTDGITTACANCHEQEGTDFHPTIDGAHTPADTGSQDCARCHGQTTDVRAIHATDQCATCHASRCTDCHVDTTAYAVKTTSCSTCHTTSGTDYHLGADSAHTFGAMDPSCSSAECHGSTSLPTVHESYLARYPQYSDTCAMCHLNDDPDRIDWSCATADCSSCHTVHGDIATLHTTDTDALCTDCHGSTDVRDLHPACSTCHNGATDTSGGATCAGCHAEAHPDLVATHTATTPASVDGCGRCHDRDAVPGADAFAIHAGSPEGACDVCHDNAARVPDIAVETIECASCHAVAGTEYHRQADASHLFGAMPSGCVGAGCHASSSLPAEHERFLGRYPGYADSCALCHLNADAGRIDWQTASADCSTCHEVHGDIEQIHQAPGSQACVDCHETPDVRDIHDDCVTCHNATVDTSGTTACAECHTKTPLETAHYPTASHLAEENGCQNCHYLDMKAEHFKPTAGPVTCVQCHELKVDSFTSPWDKRCMACHQERHGEQQVKHRSTNTTCAGSGCHNINDASDIHKGVQGGGCSVCHKSAGLLPTTTDCSAAGCHAGTGTDHHEAHNGAAANGAGCEGCHFRYLDDEHAALGMTCATCHASTNSVVTGAIAAGDRRCLTCHPGSPHNQRQAAEFGAGNASMHRVSPDLPGMRSSFLVNGSTYTMTLPAASTFLKAGYGYDTMITCASCHTYSGATGPHGATMKVNIDPAYPNTYRVTGAGESRTAQLSKDSATGMSMSKSGSSAAGIICEKCHDLYNGSSWSNVAHKEHDDRGSDGAYCNQCHVAVPHGWGRPRLIGYTTDPAAYRTWTGGLQRISLKSYTPSSWQKSDCGAGCSSSRHPLSGTSWPNVMSTTPQPTTGSVSGRVTDAATTANVSGATVTIGSASTTTASDGAYSIVGLDSGSYMISVSKTGYTTYTGTVSVAAGSTTTANVSLQPSGGGGTNLLLNKSFSASRYESATYAPGKAGDGNTGTWWWSDDRGGSSMTEWLRGDMGSRNRISRIEIAWYGAYYAKDFRVYVSTDGSSWTQVYSNFAGAGGTTNITFSARDVRYVKVECRRTSGSNTGYGIAELRAFQ